MPVPKPTDKQRSIGVANRFAELIEITSETRHVMRQGTILDWLRVEYGIEKASLKLQSPTELDSDAFVTEVRRIRGKKNPLSASAPRSCAKNTPEPSNRPEHKPPKPCNLNGK